ncbi:neuronal acetylcholine receptor subunit alpha-2-like [Frieseomelitta varia]|uniref:neuronal acetylcholine receptor subunit alpha-2-like n=1 Tax=Frieseomelitta varia TaxID=561572 RepID=UPI001CB69CAD|nr:neuronal acetylcholine receptor subunit alpha-2-like [Frieseomelitta varia]
MYSHFVPCSHRSNMKNLFPALLVIVNILLNKQAACIKLRCKDIVDNSALSRLKEYLFCDYNPKDRVLAKNNAIVVNFGLNLHQFQVDELTNTVEFSVWVQMVWTEPHFTWDKSQFDSITSLRVKSYQIWVPDIVMHST